jgi:phage baseplate assembly protein W
MDDTNAFIGAGWNLPIETDATGSIALTTGIDELEQAMYLVLATTPGERPMRPNFGCRLQEYVFAPVDMNTSSRMASDVRAALLQWEPRVSVGDVVVSPSDDAESTLWIDVSYTVKATNDRRNLVFPFYLIPEHE